jgi:hypothetical protein
MPAAIEARMTLRRDGRQYSAPVAASTLCLAGTIAALNASNQLVPMATSTTLRAVGVFEDTFDNSAGAAGAITATVHRNGWHRFANSASTDQITLSDVGSNCFAVDNQTVAKTNGSSTRSIAGVIRDVDSEGVWISFA